MSGLLTPLSLNNGMLPLPMIFTELLCLVSPSIPELEAHTRQDEETRSIFHFQNKRELLHLMTCFRGT